MIFSSLLIILLGGVSAADHTPHDAIMNTNSSCTLLSESLSEDEFHVSVQEDNAKYNSTHSLFVDDIKNQSLDISNNSINTLTSGKTDFSQLNLNEKSSYDNQYYLFRGDCWTINNNFESTAAITSKSFTDLTVTGTFRTQNDMVGLYWNSKDPIQHPYISYASRSDYSNVILEFDYEMSGCIDFSNNRISIAIETNTGENYYLTMNRFIKNNHVKINFNKLTLLPGNTYFDKKGKSVTVKKETKLDVTNIKSIMFSLSPVNYVNSNHFTIMKNKDFSCRIYNINVVNGAICAEQPALEPHQYRLCEGYDDIYNMNPLRLSNEMRKLGYVGWVNLYIGASHYYEKYGTVGDVITDMEFNNARTEKMVLDKKVPLNKAFKAWLDCYSRELKKNDVENLIISVSMENLQSPHSWRQMDCNGNFAVTGWSPSTFIYSPCNEEAIQYMQKVSEACLDIVTANGFQPILQMGEVWWWWNENVLPDQSPCFYDDSTKAKYLAEHGTALPEYANVWTLDYDNETMNWMNQQLVKYSDSISKVVKSDKYDDGLYIALFFLPSVVDTDRVPTMIRNVNYLSDAYSPYKLDILQIEDYDWVIYESIHHREAYAIGHELGFNESNLHYFGGFVLYPEDAAKYWPLIEKALEDAIDHKFKEVYVWAGTQIRRDGKILGYDEYAILQNLLMNKKPGIVSPIITSPEYVCAGENFTVNIHTNEWINGAFNVYEYDDGEKGKLLASNKITKGYSSVTLSSISIGLNKFYLEFDYVKGRHHLIQNVYIIGNSQNISVNVSSEIETGSNAYITFNAPESTNAIIYITVDGTLHKSYSVEHGIFKASILRLSSGYHNVLVKYIGGKYVDGKFIGDAYYKTFTVKVGSKSTIETSNVTAEYNSGASLVVNLKDAKGNALKGKIIKITLNGINHTVTTDNKGRATLPIDILPGKYIAEILYAGDDTYISTYATANIIVKKIATELTAKDINIIYGDSANLAVTLKDGKNNTMKGKDIIITLNDMKYALTTDKNGQISLPIDILPGKYTAKILFKEDEIYLSSSANVNVIVNKTATILTVNDITNSLIITLKDAKNNSLKGKGIAVNLNGMTYTITTDDKGQATLPIDLLPGKYTAKILFKEDNTYLSSSATVPIVINKIATSLTSNNVSFTYGNPTNLIITLKDIENKALNAKDITINLNGKNYTSITNNKGQATLPIDLLPGKYTAKIQFNEDNIYISSVITADITVNKVSTSLTSNDLSFTYGDAADLFIALKDSKGNALKGKDIAINLNSTTHTITTDDKGQATLPINLLPGKYTAKILFKEDEIYLSSSSNANIVINKAATSLASKDMTFTYGDIAYLPITLKDNENNALKGKEITINLNGTTHTVTTDNNGQATLPINLLPGKYTAKIQYKQDNTYLSSFADADILINKAATSLTTENISAVYGDSVSLIITLKDNKNNALKGKEITINLNGKNHAATTDNNGQATLPIDLLPGKYTAEIQFREDNIYSTSNTNTNITISKASTSLSAKDINILYDNPSNLVITLKNSEGNVLAGKFVTVNLNNKAYTIKTNAKGQALLNVNLAANKYNAKVRFAGDDTYLSSTCTAKVTVNKATPKITASSKTFKVKSKVKKVTVTLKNKNKAIKNAVVKLTINKKTYKVRTNSKGDAVFSIKLTKKGKFNAVFKYDSSSNFKSATKNVLIIIK